MNLRLILFGLLILTEVRADNAQLFTRVDLAPLENEQTVLEIHNGARVCEYRLADIEVMGLYQADVKSMWQNDDGRYQGVLLTDLLASCGLLETPSIQTYAVNGYQVSIPREDWKHWSILVATRKNEQPMRVRDKGPLRIIYIYSDQESALNREQTATRWIWMLNRIDGAGSH